MITPLVNDLRQRHTREALTAADKHTVATFVKVSLEGLANARRLVRMRINCLEILLRGDYLQEKHTVSSSCPHLQGLRKLHSRVAILASYKCYKHLIILGLPSHVP